MEERYPQLTKDQKMLRFLHERMEEALDRGETYINLSYYSGERRAGLFIYEGNIDIGEKFGARGARAVSIFKRLDRAGYLESDIEHTADSGVTSFRGLLNPGLAEIGELPDARERLLLGLEAAIQMVRDDPNLTPEEKKRKLDWFEEGKFIVRTLGVETVKAWWRGELPLMGG